MKEFETKELDTSSFKKLGGGGFATIFKVPPKKLAEELNREVAIKLFKTDKLGGNDMAMQAHIETLDKIRSDIDKTTPEGANQRSIIDNNMTWPKALVFKGGHFCGYVMNLIPPKYFYTYTENGEQMTKESNLGFRLGTDEIMIRRGQSTINRLGRFKLSVDLIHIAATMHKLGIILGDLSPNNIMVYVDKDDQKFNSIFIIDVDSFRKSNTAHPMQVPHTPGWFPPECWASKEQARAVRKSGGDENEILKFEKRSFTQNYQTDTYKICLAVFRLYHMGKERSVINTPSSSPQAIKLMKEEVGEEFATLIVRGIGEDPKNRPTAQELYDYVVSRSKKRKSEVD